jgi:hypothetical protein
VEKKQPAPRGAGIRGRVRPDRRGASRAGTPPAAGPLSPGESEPSNAWGIAMIQCLALLWMTSQADPSTLPPGPADKPTEERPDQTLRVWNRSAQRDLSVWRNSQAPPEDGRSPRAVVVDRRSPCALRERDIVREWTPAGFGSVSDLLLFRLRRAAGFPERSRVELREPAELESDSHILRVVLRAAAGPPDRSPNLSSSQADEGDFRRTVPLADGNQRSVFPRQLLREPGSRAADNSAAEIRSTRAR